MFCEFPCRLSTILEEVKNIWTKKLVMHSRRDAQTMHWEMNILFEIWTMLKMLQLYWRNSSVKMVRLHVSAVVCSLLVNIQCSCAVMQCWNSRRLQSHTAAYSPNYWLMYFRITCIILTAGNTDCIIVPNFAV